MNKNRVRIVRNTPEEEAEIARQIAENPNEAEWTDEDWANAKSIDELFPEAPRKPKADLEAGRTEFITILLDRETINWFQHQSGEDRRHKVDDSGGEDTPKSTLDRKARTDGNPMTRCLIGAKRAQPSTDPPGDT